MSLWRYATLYYLWPPVSWSNRGQPGFGFGTGWYHYVEASLVCFSIYRGLLSVFVEDWLALGFNTFLVTTFLAVMHHKVRRSYVTWRSSVKPFESPDLP